MNLESSSGDDDDDDDGSKSNHKGLPQTIKKGGNDGNSNSNPVSATGVASASSSAKKKKQKLSTITSTRKRIVVSTKKKKIKVKKSGVVDKKKRPRTATTAVPVNKSLGGGGGLPSFQHRHQQMITKATAASMPNNDASNEYDDQFEDIDEIPSDCYLAIQNLHSSSQGLHVPVTPINGKTSIQVVLESQIYKKFDENHSSTIFQELQDLKHKNIVRQLYCPPTGATTSSNNNIVWILTKDFIMGVWDSLNYYTASKSDNGNPERDEMIVSWFVTNLKNWTGSSIMESSMQESWNDYKGSNRDNKPSKVQFNVVIQKLLGLQVILRDNTTSVSSGNTTNDRYHLWLPKWGVVLKSWNEAKSQLISYLNLKRGELSQSNVLSKNRHTCVSTKFVLDDLVSQGVLRIIERPFGRFVQKIAPINN